MRQLKTKTKTKIFRLQIHKNFLMIEKVNQIILETKDPRIVFFKVMNMKIIHLEDHKIKAHLDEDFLVIKNKILIKVKILTLPEVNFFQEIRTMIGSIDFKKIIIFSNNREEYLMALNHTKMMIQDRMYLIDQKDVKRQAFLETIIIIFKEKISINVIQTDFNQIIFNVMIIEMIIEMNIDIAQKN